MRRCFSLEILRGNAGMEKIVRWGLGKMQQQWGLWGLPFAKKTVSWTTQSTFRFYCGSPLSGANGWCSCVVRMFHSIFHLAAVVVTTPRRVRFQVVQSAIQAPNASLACQSFFGLRSPLCHYPIVIRLTLYFSLGAFYLIVLSITT